MQGPLLHGFLGMLRHRLSPFLKGHHGVTAAGGVGGAHKRMFRLRDTCRIGSGSAGMSALRDGAGGCPREGRAGCWRDMKPANVIAQKHSWQLDGVARCTQ
jgi:hypothetical protein